MRNRIIAALMAGFLAGSWTAGAAAAERSPLLDAMEKELERSVNGMQNADSVSLYYLGYHVTDEDRYDLRAAYGALTDESEGRNRFLDIECRVGDYALDNTREIRGESDFAWHRGQAIRLPLEDDALAIRTIIWEQTDLAYKGALERYTKVITNRQVLAEEEDPSDDFSREEPHVYIGPTVAAATDREAWKGRLERLSAIFKTYPFVQTSSVTLSVRNDNRFFVNTEGTRIQTGQSYARLFVNCSGTADDGMKIDRYDSFDAETPAGLPSEDVIEATVRRLIAELEALLNAPLAEPYAGPAILVNRASGVFFHEIFGHRIEGHRQKSESEGQTFAKKIDQPILPEFISIYDDPTARDLNGTFLRGHYAYDDQGIKTSRVKIVENGVLKTFLMSRSPVRGVNQSNGHGRKQAGSQAVSRQGNLIIESTRQYPFDTLVAMMLAECRQQGKPYGLVFYDIAGGFTQTGRYGPQSFKVLPLLVYKYYADGRPPEPIRGVDIVGTPLSSFEKLVATGDDYDVFNGTCGAESGWVPVSAVSPSILVSQLEVEKKAKEQEKPPLLDPPYRPEDPGFHKREEVSR